MQTEFLLVCLFVLICTPVSQATYLVRRLYVAELDGRIQHDFSKRAEKALKLSENVLLNLQFAINLFGFL